MVRISSRCREAERTILRLLHGSKTRTQLTQIHAYFLRHGLHQSNQVLSHFVSVCASFNKMSYAHRIFSQTHYPNILLFNSIIKGYSLSGPYERSLLLYTGLRKRGIWADEYTFAPLLKCCSILEDVWAGECIHGEIIVNGFDCFDAIGIGLVEFYAGIERMEEAKKVFDEISKRDLIVWNLMVRGFCRAGNVDAGLDLFVQMKDRNVVSWNTVISCLGRCGRDSDALEFFSEMLQQGFELDEATVVSMLPVCSRLGAIDVGQWICSYAEAHRLDKDFVSVENAMVCFYCKCGDMEASRQKFESMQSRNVVSWNGMITGMAYNGNDLLGVELFEEMMKEEIIPNDATFVGVLTCCSHAGLVDKAREVFASMVANYQMEPKLEHYGCMVDLLGRKGCVREAFDLVKNMKIKPSAALWGSVLSACRTHGDVELAELAIEELIKLEPRNSGNYVLLSNLYAESGRWDEVEKVRSLMRVNNVHKVPGQSATR